jgi:hypothetical protein
MSSNHHKRLIKAVLDYYDGFGWTVLPVRDKGHPLVKWKAYQTERPTRAETLRMFEHPAANGIAVLSGSASNSLCIRDFDDRDSYQDWSAKHPYLAKSLPTDKTYSGAHVFFRAPVDCQLFRKLSDGEYRGTAKQYTVIPPSWHPKGLFYEWQHRPGKEIPLLADLVAAGLLPVDSTVNGFTHRHTLVDRKGKGTVTPSSSLLYLGSSRKRVGVSGIPDRVRLLAALCMPTGIGQRDGKLWELAQLTKVFPKADLNAVFSAWWSTARHIVGTKDEMLSWQAFLYAYVHCKRSALPSGCLLRDIETEPIPAIAEAYSSTAQRVVRICSRLQRLYGEQDFPLSVEWLGRLLGKCFQGVNVYLHDMQRDKLLVKMQQGSTFTKRASLYHYVGAEL